ncbi:hypothetical protein KEM54_002895 [Ascosphaera aggregata]|nr:hypothetical protein KEM54_002895 [Ascosphaera aggregata]
MIQSQESRATLVSGASSEVDLTIDNESFTPRDYQQKELSDLKTDIADWPLKYKVQKAKDRDAQSGLKAKELGVTWKDLSVQVLSAESAIKENFLSQLNILKHIQESRNEAPLRTILDNSHGCVKPGEMLLVLGRPGSGCTTLLNLITNKRAGYKEVSGDVFYGSLNASEVKPYRGQIVMNTEEELFFPSLTVNQTMDFATRMKVPHTLPNGVADQKAFQEEMKQFLLESMSIEHTSNTRVGNEFVRGVSGGERKRVSIIETLATRGSVYCWDNSTRGLDASTALAWAKAIRAITDILGLASIVTLYQAGNGIYEQFDKVLVLDKGKQIYYGPMKEARPFMEELGFICREGSNVADFLTGCTVPTERLIRPGYENRFPRTAEEVRRAYEATEIYSRMQHEYTYPTSEEAKVKTQTFKEAVTTEKYSRLSKKSPLTTAIHTQVRAAVIRQYQILWGDKATFIIKQGSTLVQALIAGSLFYNSPDNSGGLFTKSGALFFSLLYNSLLAMSEVTDSFTGRPVLLKHKSFAFYHPGAFCFAQVTADIPIVLFQVSVFSIIVYFMVGLTATASAFFTYWIVVFATTICMTAFFRAIGAISDTFDNASKISGFLISATIMYTGFLIQKPQMHPWFVWIYWIDPLAYGFQSLLANEFHNKVIPCVGQNLVPFDPTGQLYQNPDYQSCAGVGGAIQGSGHVTVSGDDYLGSLSYSYSNVWRNFAILWAWWVLFFAVTVVATTKWKDSSENGPSLLIPRENLKHVAAKGFLDEEGQGNVNEKNAKDEGDKPSQSSNLEANLIRNTSVFTWKNLCYTVKTSNGDRQLLDHVHGWVKPGMLGALMGSSGAGKTTLLDVLAQRKTEGTIHGSICVDGRPLPVSFQRSAGYCEQLDVHEPYATVREALNFSALLRQPRGTPREERLKYVDIIIDLLELDDIADTLIGHVGAGLSVEQRKRVTIGVELVAKPSVLVFLDEPTSGLDGQSAFNTVRFLRKLADAGQAILVTIHQPSAQLFAQFDTLLLLSFGGKTVYFGDIGDNAATVKGYFSRHGAPCPPEINPAEFMIDVVSGELSQGRDWNKVWLESPEYERMMKELDDIIETAAANPPGTVDDGYEFATSYWEQTKLVTHRSNVSVYRNTDYVNNKIMLHITSALFNGFTFWKIGSSVGDLQQRLFTIFNFIFVAPGVIAQLQPLFIERRDIWEARERKSKMYAWGPFVTGLIVSELPYLCLCAIFYFVCWYYCVGFDSDSNKAGAVFLVMLLYEFIYTGIGQFIAAYAPNAVFASLVNPLAIGILVSFCGALVPYSQIQTFWRYWIYYLNPFNFLMGSLLTFTTFSEKVVCKHEELAIFDPPSGETCKQYLTAYMEGFGRSAHLLNPDATKGCEVCQFKMGSDYLKTVNLNDYYYGWRDIGICALFTISSYALVYVLMKARTKVSKKAE